MKKGYLIIYLLFNLALTGCGDGHLNSKVIVFTQEEISKKLPEQLCRLDESRNPLGNIKDFAMITDTTFVVVDGQAAFLYNVRGEQVKQFGYRGRGSGEMLSPSSVSVSSQNVYIWCSSLMNMMVFSHNGQFRKTYKGFERAIRKFAVDDDENLYLYTSGMLNNAGNKLENIVQVYNIQKQSIVNSFGVRSGADEVMVAAANSAGVDVDREGNVLYIHPATLRFFVRSLGAKKDSSYVIEGDKEFKVEKVKDFRDVTNNSSMRIEYIPRNSIIRDIHENDGRIYIVAETGVFNPGSKNPAGSRKIKIYQLSTDKTPQKTIMYDYIQTPTFRVLNDKLLFLSSVVVKPDSSEVSQQMIHLNSLPLN